MVNRDRRKESSSSSSAIVDVVVSAQGKAGEGPVKVPAIHCASHHEVMAAPGMIGPYAVARIVGLERPAEVGHRESSDLRSEVQLGINAIVKRRHCLAHLGPQSILLAGLCTLVVVGIESTDPHEEDLPLKPKSTRRLRRGDFDHLRNRLELVREPGIRERRGEGGVADIAELSHRIQRVEHQVRTVLYKRTRAVRLLDLHQLANFRIVSRHRERLVERTGANDQRPGVHAGAEHLHAID